MIAYIIMLLLVLLIFLCTSKKSFDKKGLLMILLVFMLFYGLRNKVGNDDQGYIWMYDYFSHTLNNFSNIFSGMEFGIKFLSRIVGFFQLNYKGLFLCCSAISFTFLYKFLFKFKFDKKETLIFIFVYLGMLFVPYMIVMRHFLAISLSLYAIWLFYQKNHIKGVLLVLLASTFHNSSIFVLVLLPLFSEKIKIPNWFKITLPFLMLFLGKLGITNYIINFLSVKLSIYDEYAINNSANVFGGSGITHYFFLFVYTLSIFLNIINNKKRENVSNDECNSLENFMEKGEMIYLVLFFATINSGWALRISYIYMIFLPMIPISLLKKVKNTKYYKLIYYLFFVIFLVLIVKNLIIDTNGTNLASNDFSIDFFGQK